MQNHNKNNVDWIINENPVDYVDAVNFMEERVDLIRSGTSKELIWLLEHPPLYTAGTSAKQSELLDSNRFPIFNTGRGGRYTYHGPGQRVVYVMLDLKMRKGDVRLFINDLEDWVISTLADFNVVAERVDNAVGIWVRSGAPLNPVTKLNKIAAIGIRIRKWISFHGISLNIDPVLDHYSGIVPCGVTDSGITSLWDLGFTPSRFEVDTSLRFNFEKIFMRSTNLVNLEKD